jgi:hypothetical protein
MATEIGSGPSATSDGAAIPDNPSILDGGNGIDVPVSDGDGTPGNPRDPAVAVKRGRGRPRKDGGDGTNAGTGSDKGSPGNQSKPKSGKTLDVDLFASQLVGVHKMLAAVTKNPLWEISDKESKTLAEALKNIMAFHSISISPQYLAYFQLLAAVATIYGPRLAIIMAANKAEREAKRNTFDATTGQPIHP